MNLSGLDAYDPEGARIGRVGSVYLNRGSGEPEWVTVHTGLLGRRERYLPLAGALPVERGLRVGMRKDVVKGAPRADGPLTDLGPLCAYYGLPPGPLPVAAARTPEPPDMPRRRYVVAPDHTVTERPAG
jgi:hypothetical protein